MATIEMNAIALNHQLSTLSGGAWITSFFAIGTCLVLATIAVFLLIDSWLHKRRLKRLHRETEEAVQREREQTRRARFLL